MYTLVFLPFSTTPTTAVYSIPFHSWKQATGYVLPPTEDVKDGHYLGRRKKTLTRTSTTSINIGRSRRTAKTENRGRGTTRASSQCLSAMHECVRAPSAIHACAKRKVQCAMPKAQCSMRVARHAHAESSSANSALSSPQILSDSALAVLAVSSNAFSRSAKQSASIFFKASVYTDSLDAMDPAGVLTAGVLTPGEDTICTGAVHRTVVVERSGSIYI